MKYGKHEAKNYSRAHMRGIFAAANTPFRPGDLALKHFSVTDADGEFARLRKTFAGITKEMLTPSDHYRVEFTGQVSISRKPCEAVNRWGYSMRLSSQTRTPALFHQ